MHLVEEFEGPVVNVDLIDREVVLQTLQEMRHASLDFHALQTLSFDLWYFNMDPRNWFVAHIMTRSRPLMHQVMRAYSGPFFV